MGFNSAFKGLNLFGCTAITAIKRKKIQPNNTQLSVLQSLSVCHISCHFPHQKYHHLYLGAKVVKKLVKDNFHYT